MFLAWICSGRHYTGMMKHVSLKLYLANAAAKRGLSLSDSRHRRVAAFSRLTFCCPIDFLESG